MTPFFTETIRHTGTMDLRWGGLGRFTVGPEFSKTPRCQAMPGQEPRSLQAGFPDTLNRGWEPEKLQPLGGLVIVEAVDDVNEGCQVVVKQVILFLGVVLP